jgi:hypothetical protein
MTGAIRMLAAAAVMISVGAEPSPVLRSGEVDITFVSARACEVTMTLAAEGVSELDHRIEAFEGSEVDLVEIKGARQVGETRTVGRTKSLVLQPLASTYGLRYRVAQPAHRDHRCPLWVPAVPTDGRSRAIDLEIDVPSSTIPGRTMPTVTWNGTHGTTTLGHLPAFVRVPFSAAGEPAEWDISRTMDVVTITLVVGVTALWVWRRKR